MSTTPEEKAVIKAAKRWARKAIAGTEHSLTEAELLLAVQALKVSQQPEHTVAAIPCSAPSTTGRMVCELPIGHDPDDSLRWTPFAADGWCYAYRTHQSHARDGSKRTWKTWVEAVR